MRSLLIPLLAFSSVFAIAQQPATPLPTTGKGWEVVRALRPGSSLDIKLRQAGRKCIFRSADADTLTCNHGTDLILQRTDILRIKVHHRGRSTLAGLAIGGGTGAIIGYASTGSCGSDSLCVVARGAVAAILGVGGGAIGALTGYFSDFTRSVVYTAP